MYSRNELGKYFQEHYKTGLGVEVGVQYGYFFKEILKDWKGILKGVDSWDGYESSYQQAIENVGAENLIRKTSVEASKDFKDESLDFVYIDADHQYNSVKEDIEAWFPKVRKGGIVSGHDYVTYENYGVIKAVDEFAEKNGYKVELTEVDMNPALNFNFISWYFKK